MKPKITAEQRASYHEKGFVSLGTWLDPEEVEALRADLALFARTHPHGDFGLIYNNLWQKLPRFHQLISSPALVDAVCSLLEVPELVLFQDNLVWKSPGSGRIEWHQDYSYQPLGSARGVTLWVSLDEATPENGCLHYVPGTHITGECQPANFTAGCHQPPIEGLPVMDLTNREREIVFVGASPGEILAHHPLVWHMTPPNTSTRQRRAYTINWITPDVVWESSHAPHPFNYYVRMTEGEAIQGEMFPHFRSRDGDQLGGDDPVEGG